MTGDFENVDLLVQVGEVHPELAGHKDLYAMGDVFLFSSWTGKVVGESKYIAHLHINEKTGLIKRMTTFQWDGVGEDLLGPMRILALATPEEWKKF